PRQHANVGASPGHGAAVHHLQVALAGLPDVPAEAVVSLGCIDEALALLRVFAERDVEPGLPARALVRLADRAAADGARVGRAPRRIGGELEGDVAGEVADVRDHAACRLGHAEPPAGPGVQAAGGLVVAGG